MRLRACCIALSVGQRARKATPLPPGTSTTCNTHRRSSGPSLTGGCVVRSAQPVLRPPPTPTRPATHFPRSSVIKAPRSSTTLRRSPGRGGPHQFPSPLSERSEPQTPGSSSAPVHSCLLRLPWPFTLISGARHSLRPPERTDLSRRCRLRITLGTAQSLPFKGFRHWAPT
jgi:hypothetical protein